MGYNEFDRYRTDKEAGGKMLAGVGNVGGGSTEGTRERHAIQIERVRLALREAELEVKDLARRPRPVSLRGEAETVDYRAFQLRRAEIDVERVKLDLRQAELDLEEFEAYAAAAPKAGTEAAQ